MKDSMLKIFIVNYKNKKYKVKAYTKEHAEFTIENNIGEGSMFKEIKGGKG